MVANSGSGGGDGSGSIFVGVWVLLVGMGEAVVVGGKYLSVACKVGGAQWCRAEVSSKWLVSGDGKVVNVVSKWEGE